MLSNKLCEIDILKKWNDIKLYIKNNYSFFFKWMFDCFYIFFEGFFLVSKDKLYKKDKFLLICRLIFIIKREKCLNNIKGGLEW